ncbi:MAG: sugar phosphate nucleotidyltransferase [Candidatus Nanoarchaeia archaeon]|nr:sugar phosphate nucleotidyltransferase [Candidatus Nanoarchaeia archaeon]
MKQKISITIDKEMLKRIDSIIDNIIIRNRSQAIERLVGNSLGENRTAVILSGGNEDSMKISNDEYRITAKLKKSTIVEKAVNKLRQNNFKRIYVIARPNILTSVFNILRDGSSYGVKIEYVEEKESDGSASSLKILNGKLSSSFLVVFGDIIFERVNIEELWNQHFRNNSVATLMLTTSPEPSRKGIVKMEGTKILKFEQKPKESDIYIGFSSMFVAEPEILTHRGHSLEYDIFPKLAERGLLQGHLSSEKEVHIHTKEDIKKYC